MYRLQVIASFISIINSVLCLQNGLICRPHISRFSSSSSIASYYECTTAGDYAVLKSCPEGLVYWPTKQQCDKPRVHKFGLRVRRAVGTAGVNSDDLSVINQPRMGRIALLGDLYDARKNVIYPGTSFWSPTTIQNAKIKSMQPNQKTDFFAARTTLDRMEYMDIAASLKLDFMGGLISVSGSAEFLKESVKYEDEVNINMAYHATTHTETLPSTTKKDFIEQCGKKQFTHVVSSLTYGMDAFFSFKKKIQNAAQRSSLSGSLKAVINKIPAFKIEAEAKVNLTEQEKAIAKNMNVKLYGDFILQLQPTTYEDAIQVYAKLPQTLGNTPDYKGASPISIQLTPITMYCKEADVILVGISEFLMSDLTKVLDKMEKLLIKAKTLASSEPSLRFLPVKRNINEFVRQLEKYRYGFQGKLQSILPNIRGGGENSGEDQLIALLSNYTKSPFNYETSNRFLGMRSREIQAIKAVLDQLTAQKDKNLQIVDYEAANDVINLLNKKYVVVFELNVLQKRDIIEKFLQDGVPLDETGLWFNKNEDVGRVGQQFRLFRKFALANTNLQDTCYLVKVMNVKTIAVSIYAQVNGKKMTTNFIVPDVPINPVFINRTHDTISFSVAKPDNAFIKSCEVTFWEYFQGRKSGVRRRNYPFNSLLQRHITVDKLKAATAYNFEIKYVTEVGKTGASTEPGPRLTTPSSEPTSLQIKSISDTSIGVEWYMPTHVGKGIIISSYKATIKDNGKVIQELKVNGRATTFSSLTPATKYQIDIRAILPDTSRNVTVGNINSNVVLQHESLPALISGFTSPLPPSIPTLVKVNFHDASINWRPSPRVAAGSSVLEYKVKYTILDNSGANAVVGTAKSQSAQQRTQADIKDLHLGTTYGIQVQVITSHGRSDYSSMLIIKTMYKETELDTLRNGLRKELQSNVKSISSSLKADIDRTKATLNASQSSLNSMRCMMGLYHNQPDHVTVELRGGNTKYEGNVYMCGRPICDEGWDIPDGFVTCVTLGFKGVAEIYRGSKYGALDNHNYIMQKLKCHVYLLHIMKCKNDGIGVHQCGTNRGAGVRCMSS